MWYVSKAYNSTALRGYTDDPAIAAAYCRHLNRSRQVNPYSVHAVTEEELQAAFANGAAPSFITQAFVTQLLNTLGGSLD